MNTSRTMAPMPKRSHLREIGEFSRTDMPVGVSPKTSSVNGTSIGMYFRHVDFLHNCSCTKTEKFADSPLENAEQSF
jgi:hypothetical protein